MVFVGVLLGVAIGLLVAGALELGVLELGELVTDDDVDVTRSATGACVQPAHTATSSSTGTHFRKTTTGTSSPTGFVDAYADGPRHRIQPPAGPPTAQRQAGRPGIVLQL
jgi:hypothetical protein